MAKGARSIAAGLVSVLNAYGRENASRPNDEGTPLPVSDVTLEPSSEILPMSAGSTALEDERPPSCPSCNKRLVILATHSVRDGQGMLIRQQLWGCPKGHCSATRRAGAFSPVMMLGDLIN
jgi:hypothetical protein